MGSQPTPSQGSNPLAFLIDAVAAVILLLALLAVYLLDRRLPGNEKPFATVTPPVIVPTKPEPPPVKPLRLAVTHGRFDDMGKLLESMGPGFKFQPLQLDDLRDKDKLSHFDVVFCTCGTVPESWVERKLENSLRPGTIGVIVKQEVIDRAAENLKSFVNGGGTLYASDLRLSLLVDAFPELVDLEEIHDGRSQIVTADVVDSGLAQLLGSRQISLKFDKNGWKPAAFHGKSVQVYLKGRYQTSEGDSREAPLLVKFPFGRGQVIFTSFHNEQQTNGVEQQLLKFLVFSVVMAKTEAAVTRTMVQGGFSPASRNLLSASPEAPSMTQTYSHTKVGPLQFVVGFENQGAHLKLKVTSPRGKEYNQEGQSTFVIDIPSAEAGDWTYTVTGATLPYANFPYTVTVGEK